MIRNPKTLDYIDFAPVYDSGTSLSYDKDILSYDYKSKPFNKNPQEQLKLDTSKLRGISDFIKETLYPAVYYNIMTADRPSKIASFVERRIEYVDSLSHTRNRQQEQPLRNDLIEQQKQCGGYTPPVTPVKQEQSAPEKTAAFHSGELLYFFVTVTKIVDKTSKKSIMQYTRTCVMRENTILGRIETNGYHHSSERKNTIGVYV